jgi:hypothetical protein
MVSPYLGEELLEMSDAHAHAVVEQHARHVYADRDVQPDIYLAAESANVAIA